MSCVNCNGGKAKCNASRCIYRTCRICEHNESKSEPCHNARYERNAQKCHRFRLSYKFREARKYMQELIQ